MQFTEMINRVVEDTFGKSSWFDVAKYWDGSRLSFLDGSLLMFLPEIVLAIAIVLLLLVRLFNADQRLPGGDVALCGAFIALILTVLQFLELKTNATFTQKEYFTGLLVYDQFAVFFRLFLLLFLVLVTYLTRLSGIPDREDAPDFYTLLIGATLGMMLMTSANHVLILFLGIEMTSVPSYAMVGFLKGRKSSSEAALKYVVYGGGAAGVMLYGLSLLSGLLGTAELPEMAHRLMLVLGENPGVADPTVRTLLLAVIMVLVGLAFKLSIFPFHFWAPDAFEGASAEVAGFLSVASKGAAFALLVRFCLALIGGANENHPESVSRLFMFIGVGLGVIAAVTATFGNLAAYGQTNMKRLLAYSTIAHAGYMLMAVAAMMVILSGDSAQSNLPMRGEQAQRCLEALLYYLWVYLFMNLGAFTVVALVRNEIFSEEIADYAGLIQQAPGLAVCMAVCLFSLVGLPPFGGFWGKLLIFMGLFQAGAYHWSMYAVLVIGTLNTVFSLFYYVRVLKFMILDPVPEQARRFRFPAFSAPAVFVAGLSALVLLSGIIIQPWANTAREVAAVFFP